MEAPTLCTPHNAVRVMQLALSISILSTAAFLLHYRIKAHANVNNEPLVLVIVGAVAFFYALWVILSYRRFHPQSHEARQARGRLRSEHHSRQQRQVKPSSADQQVQEQPPPVELGQIGSQSSPITPPPAAPYQNTSPSPLPPRQRQFRGILPAGASELHAPEDQDLPTWRSYLHAFCALVIIGLLIAGAVMSFIMGHQGVPCKTLKDGQELGDGYIPVRTNSLSLLGSPLTESLVILSSAQRRQLLGPSSSLDTGDQETGLTDQLAASDSDLPEYQPGKEYSPVDMCQNVYMDLDRACGVLSILAAILWSLDFLYIVRAILRTKRLRKKNRTIVGGETFTSLGPPYDLEQQQQYYPYQQNANCARYGQPTGPGHNLRVPLSEDEYDDYHDTLDGRRMRGAPQRWLTAPGRLNAGTAVVYPSSYPSGQDCTIPMSMRSSYFGETEHTLQQKARRQSSFNSLTTAVARPSSEMLSAAPLSTTQPPSHVLSEAAPPLQPELAVPLSLDATNALDDGATGPERQSRSRSCSWHHHHHPHSRPHSCSRSRSRARDLNGSSQESPEFHTEESCVVSSSTTDRIEPALASSSLPLSSHALIRVPLDQETAEQNGILDQQQEEEDTAFDETEDEDDNDDNAYVHYPAGPACYAFHTAEGCFQPTYFNMAARRERHYSASENGQSTQRARSRSTSRTRSPITPAPIRKKVLITGLDPDSGSATTTSEGSDADSKSTPPPPHSPPLTGMAPSRTQTDEESQQTRPSSSPLKSDEQIETEEELQGRIDRDPYDNVVRKKLPPGVKLNARSRTQYPSAYHHHGERPLRAQASTSSLNSASGSPASTMSSPNILTGGTGEDIMSADDSIKSPIYTMTTIPTPGSPGNVDSTSPNVRPNKVRSRSSRHAKTGSDPQLSIDTNVRPSLRARYGPASSSASAGVSSGLGSRSPLSAASSITIGQLQSAGVGDVNSSGGGSQGSRPSFHHNASKTSINSLQYRGDF